MKKKVTKAEKTKVAVAAKPAAVKTLAAKPAAGSDLSPDKLKFFQELLQKKRDDILSTSQQKKSDIAYGEIGDEADVASQTFEREMLFELTNTDRIVLDDVEAALRKIEKNEFGICEWCRKKISIERLKAMPWARYCIECQSRTESPR